MIKSLVKTYFKNFLFFYKRMGNRIFVMVMLTVFVGVMDGMGLTMFLPLFQIAAKEGENHNVTTSEDKAGALMHWFHMPITLVNILTIMVVFYLIKGAFQFIKSKYDTDTGRYFMLRTRKRL